MAITDVKIYDQQRVDYLVVNGANMTTQEVNDIFIEPYEPDWGDFGSTGLILAAFNGTLASSYISGLTSALAGFKVYRKRVGETRLYKVCEVDKDTLGIIDYLVRNNIEYQWMIYPITTEEIGVSLESLPQKANFETWTVTFINEVSENVYVPEQVWKFKCNLSSSAFVQNIDKTQFNNYTQYPKFSVGATNYITGGLTCLLGDVSTEGTYDEPIDMWIAWNEMIASGRECLIADTKGNLIKGQIISNQGTQMQNIVDEPPTSISFRFTETGSLKEAIVYEVSLIDE
jgi:hypothetical protein